MQYMNTEALERLIDAKCASQSEFAKAIGVSEAFVSGMLKGYKMPSAGKLKEIADYFGVSMDELMN